MHDSKFNFNKSGMVKTDNMQISILRTVYTVYVQFAAQLCVCVCDCM